MQISGHKTRRYNIVSEGIPRSFPRASRGGGHVVDESLLNYVIPSALTFVAGYLLKFVGPWARVVHWFPAYFGFQVTFTGAGGAQQVATVTTHALSIQNVGWRAARKLVGGRADHSAA